MLLGILGDGHVLLEDVPGLAKTLTARSFAEASGLGFSRVQFTPDLLPADVTGSSIWNQRDGEFEFRPGPIFTHLLLADEINRAPPKTQAALLEAMQERQVTTDGVTRPLERPFLVLATQNPIEYEGTYPLPEAQLDRFLLRTGFGYPDADAEWEMLARRIERRGDDVSIAQVIDRETLLEMQAAVELVHVEPSVGRYVVELVAATRESSSLAVGASPRGSLALLKLSRCRAALAGRDFVTPDDVKAVAVPALAHRLVLKPELWVQRRSGEDVVRETLATVPTPRAEDVAPREHVTPFASPRLVPYVGLAALGLIAALALRRAELVVLAAPFALVVAAGLLFERRPDVGAWLSVDRDRALEGDEIDADDRGQCALADRPARAPPARSSRAEVVEGDNPVRHSPRVPARSGRCR